MIITFRSLVLGLILSSSLLGCSSNQLVIPANIPPQVELAQVPFFEQELNQCGAASLATVLANDGLEVSAKELAPLLYIPEKEGTVSIEMDALARQQGRLVYPVNKISALITEVEAGHPVLVLQNLGLSWLPQWHYAVVVGYDLNDSILILRSGNKPRRQISIKTFSNTWRRSDNWGRVIVAPDVIPATAEPLIYLSAAADLEQTGQSQAALMAYQTTFNGWNDVEEVNQLASLGASNIYYGEGDLLAAKQWLLMGEPLSASAWNNLAYVLIGLSCKQQALSAIQCATSLEPENDDFHASSVEIRSMAEQLSGVPDEDYCDLPRCGLAGDNQEGSQY